jgi:hypothetical protein
MLPSINCSEKTRKNRKINGNADRARRLNRGRFKGGPAQPKYENFGYEILTS